MADLIALIITVLVAALVMFKRTSSGVAILAVFAGVSIEQLLSKWIIGYIPNAIFDSTPYALVAVKLIITFTPVLIVLLTTKATKRSTILSLITALLLGFLLFSFGLQILDLVPDLGEHTKNSGLLHFIDPYRNIIYLTSVVLAMVEIVHSHRHKPLEKTKGKKGKH